MLTVVERGGRLRSANSWAAAIQKNSQRFIMVSLRLANDFATADACAGMACRQAIVVATLAKVVSVRVQNNRPADHSVQTCTRRHKDRRQSVDTTSWAAVSRFNTSTSSSTHGRAKEAHRIVALGCQ